MATASTPTTEPPKQWLEDQKREFDGLVRRLNVDSDTQKHAWGLLVSYYEKESGNIHTSSDDMKVLPICAIYLISSKSLPALSSSVSCISLSQLLRQANLKVVDFFEPLEHFINTLYKDEKDTRTSCLAASEFLQSKFLVVTLLYKKYEKLFDEYFSRSSAQIQQQQQQAAAGGAGMQSPAAGGRTSSKKRNGNISTTNNNAHSALSSLAAASAATSSSSLVDSGKIFNLGWLLFLVARSKLLNTNPPDYVKSIYLLYCCFDVLLVHAAPHLLKNTVEQLIAGTTTPTSTPARANGANSAMLESDIGPANPPAFDVKTEGVDASQSAVKSSSSSPDTLRVLCGNKEAQYTTAKDFQQRVFVPFLSNLITSSVLQCQERQPQPHPLLSRVLYVPGFIDRFIDANLKALEREYEMVHFGSCDFDERLFLSNHPQLQTPSKPASGNGSSASAQLPTTPAHLRLGSPRPLQLHSNSFLAPAAGGASAAAVPLSPARAALGAVQWLAQATGAEKAISSDPALDSQLSLPTRLHELLTTIATDGSESELKAEPEFSSTGNDAAPTSVNGMESAVVKRVRQLVLENKGLKFPVDDELRKYYTIQMYYRILTSMLVVEDKRLRASGEDGEGEASLAARASISLRRVILNDKFHRSLLAVALEVVLACFNATSMPPELDFPFSATVVGVKPFDLSTIIENAIRHEQDMPRVALKHLTRIEERILETHAWEEGSPLFDELSDDTRVELLNRLKDTGTPGKPVQSPCYTFSSPTKRAPSTPQSKQPQQQPQAQQTRLNISVELFFRKVAHLGSLRIRKLCRDLTHNEPFTISEKLLKQIEYAFLYIETQTTLPQNRHMDQIIMCVLYALAKVSIPNKITFKAIIEKYHFQPQAKASVYRFVRINSADEEADIIQFYNKVMLPTVEKFLLEFQPETTNEPERPADLSNVPHGSSTEHLQVFSPLPKPVRPSAWARNLRPSIPSSPQPQTPLRTPTKVPNIHISPLKHGATGRESSLIPSAAATPLLLHHRPSTTSQNKASISYQFGMSPHKNIDDINKSVNRESARKKLDFGGGSNGDEPKTSSTDAPALAPPVISSPAMGTRSSPRREPPATPPATTHTSGYNTRPNAKRKLNLAMPEETTTTNSSSPSKKPKPTPF